MDQRARIMARLHAILAALVLAPAAGAQEIPAYVGSAACAGCHTAEAEAWARSHHGLAWTEPSPATVVADFDGTEFAHDGMLARFRIDEGGSYHATVTERTERRRTTASTRSSASSRCSNT